MKRTKNDSSGAEKRKYQKLTALRVAGTAIDREKIYFQPLKLSQSNPVTVKASIDDTASTDSMMCTKTERRTIGVAAKQQLQPMLSVMSEEVSVSDDCENTITDVVFVSNKDNNMNKRGNNDTNIAEVSKEQHMVLATSYGKNTVAEFRSTLKVTDNKNPCRLLENTITTIEDRTSADMNMYYHGEYLNMNWLMTHHDCSSCYFEKTIPSTICGNGFIVLYAKNLKVKLEDIQIQVLLL